MIVRDLENVRRTLISGGVGVGFLHEATALEAQERSEVELIGNGRIREVSLIFACLAGRMDDPLIAVARSLSSRAENDPIASGLGFIYPCYSQQRTFRSYCPPSP